MCRRKLINYLASTMLVLPLILLSAGSYADEQLLSEVAVSGESIIVPLGSGVAIPDLPDALPESYEFWVEPDTTNDFRAVTFSTRGLIVLDGNVIREFGPPRVDPVTGLPIDNEKFGDAFPVDCTKLIFMIPKKRGDKPEFLSECSAIVALNDGTLRVLGKSKGNSFVSIAYNPAISGCLPELDFSDPANPPSPEELEARTCTAVRQADGTPPQITDATNDESDSAATRGGQDGDGPWYWALGERKKVIRFPITADPTNPLNRDKEQGFEVVATLNGLKLDGIAPYGNEQVIVADDDGRLLAVDTNDGQIEGVFHSSDVCTPLGRKTPQRFSVRGDSEGEFLFFGNRACGTLTVLKEVFDQGMRTFPGAIVDTDGDGAGPPFLFKNDSGSGIFGDFKPEALTLRTGQSGDFEDCSSEDVSAACQLALQNNGAVQFATALRPGPDSSFRGFQFVLNDCRHSEPSSLSRSQPCPITNCKTQAVGTIHGDSDGGCLAPNPNDQNLDIMQLALSADASGEFRQLLDDPADPPVITLPGYLRAEDFFPNEIPLPPPPDDGPFVDNEWTFFWIFLFSDAVFDGVFKTQYNLDELRSAGFDLCDKLPAFSDLTDVNQRTNVIAYTPSTYNTIARPGQDVGNDHKGAIVINSFCNRGGGSSFNWSGQVVGIGFTNGDPDPITGIADPETFLDFTLLQMDELQRAKDELLCNANLEIPPGEPIDEQLLSPSDCDDLIQPELDQMLIKLLNCHDSARVIQGGSAENCNALFTKIGLLRTRLDFEVTWPAPAIPNSPTEDELRILRPNYEGEFKARLDAFEFAVSDWFLPSISVNGIDAPILRPIGEQSVDEGATLVVDLLAIDPNDDSMTLTAIGLPAFCPLTDNDNGTGNITCNPVDGDAGTYPTEVTVTDSSSDSLTDSETFDIVVDMPMP